MFKFIVNLHWPSSKLTWRPCHFSGLEDSWNHKKLVIFGVQLLIYQSHQCHHLRLGTYLSLMACNKGMATCGKPALAPKACSPPPARRMAALGQPSVPLKTPASCHERRIMMGPQPLMEISFLRVARKFFFWPKTGESMISRGLFGNHWFLSPNMTSNMGESCRCSLEPKCKFSYQSWKIWMLLVAWRSSQNGIGSTVKHIFETTINNRHLSSAPEICWSALLQATRGPPPSDQRWGICKSSTLTSDRPYTSPASEPHCLGYRWPGTARNEQFAIEKLPFSLLVYRPLKWWCSIVMLVYQSVCVCVWPCLSVCLSVRPSACMYVCN